MSLKINLEKPENATNVLHKLACLGTPRLQFIRWMQIELRDWLIPFGPESFVLQFAFQIYEH
jgi:hypothetical protein